MQRRIGHVVLPLAFLIATAGPPANAQQQIVIEAGPPGGEPMMMPPGLGGPRQLKTGTGRILGRVVSTDTGGPLRRAQVRLTAPEIGVKVALTDAEGRFEFRELPAGRFTLNASKSGYVTVQVRADASVRTGTADRARRQAGARQGRCRDATRRRDLGPHRRRVRRSAAGCARQCDASDLVQRPAPPAPDRTHQPDQRPGPVPDVRSAARRVLHQRLAPEHRHHDHGCRAARRRIVGCLRIDAVLRVRADLFPWHDHGSQRPASERGGWSGGSEHRLRAGPGTAREDHGHGDDVRRQASRRRNRDGDADQPNRRSGPGADGRLDWPDDQGRELLNPQRCAG